MRVGVGVFLLGSAGIIFGQQPQFWQPEVRRALPVEKPSPTPGAGPQGHPCRETCSHPAFLTPAGSVSEPRMDGAGPTFPVSARNSPSGIDSVQASGAHLGGALKPGPGRGDSGASVFTRGRERRHPAQPFYCELKKRTPKEN